MKVLALLAIVSLVGLTACESQTEPTNSDVILPLAIGNTWIYENTDYDTLGAVIRTTTDTMAVVGEVTIGSDHWYLFTGPEGDTSSVRNKADGLYFVRNGEEIRANLYPCKPGDQVINRSDTSSLDSTQLFEYIQDVETIHSAVEVPAGTFSCVKYKDRYRYNNIKTGVISYTRHEDITYIAPNVGLVQLQSMDKSEGGTPYMNSRMTLISYTLK